eukprot:16408734-Heterocapsa_arctica.AAC.1
MENEKIEPEDGRVREVRGVPLPKAPSSLEVERHALVHVPYMPWCSTCVRGRGRDAPHHGAPVRGIPLVQWDCTFFKTMEKQDVLSPILVGYWMGC